MRPEFGSPDDLYRRRRKNEWVKGALAWLAVLTVLFFIIGGIATLVQHDSEEKAKFATKCKQLNGYTVQTRTDTECRQKNTGYIMMER